MGMVNTVHLRPNPRPRIEAFQQQLLSLQRMGTRQAQLNIQSMAADAANMPAAAHHRHQSDHGW